METTSTPRSNPSGRASKTSLEGWKQGHKEDDDLKIENLKNFLRGMETRHVLGSDVPRHLLKNFLRGMETPCKRQKAPPPLRPQKLP